MSPLTIPLLVKTTDLAVAQVQGEVIVERHHSQGNGSDHLGTEVPECTTPYGVHEGQ
jgi:hypothetical protein